MQALCLRIELIELNVTILFTLAMTKIVPKTQLVMGKVLCVCNQDHQVTGVLQKF